MCVWWCAVTTFLPLSALGLLLGLVLARLAARGRRIRLAMELKQAEAEVERLGYIETALTAYPFGESIPMVSTALTSARILRHSARRRAELCRQALAGRGNARA